MAEGGVTFSDGSLKFDNDTLKAIAKVYLEEGNKEHRRKELGNAIYFYTEGIQVNCKDEELNAKLYSNRATANLHLGNYQETFSDAAAAVNLEPTFIKAIERGASACVKMQRYKEAMIWCVKGFAIDKKNKTLLDLWARCAVETASSHLGDTYQSLGDHYRQLEDFKTAIYYYKRCLEINKGKGNNARKGTVYCNLGNIYIGLGDLKTAIYYHTSCIKIANIVGHHEMEGKAYCNLGNSYGLMGDHKTAIDYHKRSLKIFLEIGDKKGEQAAYGNLGNAYQCLVDFKTAIYYHELSLKIAKKMGDHAMEGQVYSNLGNTYESMGDLRKAIDYTERGLKIAIEMGDKAGEGVAYGILSTAYGNLGYFKTAIDYLERLLKIAKERGDKVREAYSYANLGNVYQSLSEFQKAIDYYERDLKITKEVGDKAGEGLAYGRLGQAYGCLGDFKKAIDYHERSLKIAKEMGDKKGVTAVYSNMGNAYYCLGDLEKAIDYNERCLKIAEEVGLKREVGLSYGNLGAVYCSLGDFETGIDYYERCLKLCKEEGYKAGVGGAYCNLGNAYYSLGDFKTSIEYFQRHLEIAKEVGNKTGVAKSFHGLGENFESQGSPLQALDYFHSSMKIFNEIRNNLQGKDEWKIYYSDMYQYVCASLWRLSLKQGKVVQALFAAEQGRAQALNDLMEMKYGLEAASYRSQAREDSSYYSLSLDFLPSTAIFMATDERDIVFWVVQNGSDVELKRKELSDGNSLNLNKFFKSLLETASEEIGARVGLTCEDRSLGNLRDEVGNERSPQTRPNPVPFHTSALRTLYDVIIDPIGHLIQGKELILVPEGPLCLAPFAAFRDPSSRYLCEFYRIRVIPSLTSLKLITDCPDDYHSKTGVLLVGDPWVQEVVYQGNTLEQLKWAREEVQMIGRILSTAPLTGREATKHEVLRRLSSVALVHIAAHGRMETGEIALAPSTTRTSQIPVEEDFLLTMKDVMSVQIRARLVVLSCCHSGRGDIRAEGVVGIARAFLGAGARSVLVSLWAIDDEATMEFMNSFYSQLVKGRSASESLNLAMKCMRESDKFGDVKYWAPFVLIGDDVTLEFGGSE